MELGYYRSADDGDLEGFAAVKQSQSMIAKSDVLFIKLLKEPPRRLLESLQNRGFQTRITQDISLADELCSEMANPILLAFVEGLESDTAMMAKRIVARPELFRRPLVFVGKNADKFNSQLGESFEYCATINAPCDSGKLIALIQSISEQCNLEEFSFSSSKIDKPRVEEPAKIDTKIIEVEEEIPHDAYLGSLMSGLGQASASTVAISKSYVSESLEDRKAELLPANKRESKAINEFLTNSAEWSQNHFHRVSFISGELSKLVGIPEKLSESLKASSYLYAWELDPRSSAFLKRDYFRPGNADLRKRLCSRIKDSAMKVVTDLKDKDTGALIAQTAKLIGDEARVDDSDESMAASLLMASELMDRVCFGPGSWNPRNAHRLITKLSQGKIKNIHPKIAFFMIKVLTDASNLMGSIRFLAPKVKNGKVVLQAHENILNFEKRVHITDLAPGMRLTRKVSTYDGKLLLEPRVPLDRDLIFRLWRLSAVRPLMSDDAIVENIH